MQVVLLLAGIVAIGAGIATLLASVGNGKFDPGHPLITAGTVALTGGLLLLGLTSVITRLRRIADALDSQPLPRSIAGAGEPQAEPVRTAQPPVVESSPDLQQANEGKDIVSDVGAQAGQAAPIAAAPAITGPPTEKREPTLVAGTPMVPPLATPIAEDSAVAPPTMEWPRVNTGDRAPPVSAPVELPLSKSPSSRGEDGVSDHMDVSETQDSPVSAEPPRVLKSGVIEGMAYTLYSDGSVEAELRQGTTRFASIGEWRAYMREQP